MKVGDLVRVQEHYDTKLSAVKPNSFARITLVDKKSKTCNVIHLVDKCADALPLLSDNAWRMMHGRISQACMALLVTSDWIRVNVARRHVGLAR